MATGNPLFDRGSPRDKGKHGRLAEKRTAKRLKATVTPGSGALDGAKGDFSLAQFLIENKATVKASYSLQQEVWHKIYAEALEQSKTPALAIQFVTGSGAASRRDRLVVIPEWLFEELTQS